MWLSDELEEPSRSKNIRYDAWASELLPWKREMVDGTGAELANYVEACQVKKKKQKRGERCCDNRPRVSWCCTVDLFVSQPLSRGYAFGRTLQYMLFVAVDVGDTLQDAGNMRQAVELLEAGEGKKIRNQNRQLDELSCVCACVLESNT